LKGSKGSARRAKARTGLGGVEGQSPRLCAAGATRRTTLLEGAVHLVMFFVYLVLVFNP
jgi:hypothetical protein